MLNSSSLPSFYLLNLYLSLGQGGLWVRVGVVGDCFVAKLPRCSGEAIIETGGDLDTSESDGEVEVRGVFFLFLGNISSYLV